MYAAPGIDDSAGKGRKSFENWSIPGSTRRFLGDAGLRVGPSTVRRPHVGLASAATLLVLAIATTALLPPVAAANANFRVSVSYTPNASDPLLINFTATVIPGTPTQFNWNFGDGRYYNGSGPGFFTPAHLYPAGGGTFLLTVTVFEGTAFNSTSLNVTVVPTGLTVSVRASAVTGTAPFTVSFDATVQGGSGTYLSLTWNFGDGGVGSGFAPQYTFVTPGRFVVTVNATDSLGTSSRASVNVSVAAGPGTSHSLWSGLDWPAMAIGAAIGAAVAVVAAGLFIRSRLRAAHVPPATLPAPVPVEPVVEETPAPVAPAPVPQEADLPGPTPPEPTESAPRPTQEALRTSQRIVIHLASQGRIGPDDIATIGFSQPGISKSLGVRQNALTNVLRRLVAAGVLSEDVRHVRGQPRRLKVYQLTSRGEALARELRAASRAPRTDE